MRVLGVDPGLTRCGVGVVEGVPGRPCTLVAYYVVYTDPDDDLALRLLHLDRSLTELVAEHRPESVAVERVFSQHNVRTVMGTAQASGDRGAGRGAGRAAGADVHPERGQGRRDRLRQADKAQVTAMVTRLLRLAEPPRPADAADALALAICHVWRGGTARPSWPRRPTGHDEEERDDRQRARHGGRDVGPDSAVIEVGGVGLAVHCAPGTLAGLRVGRGARLATSLVVREDSLTLYGFADDDAQAAVRAAPDRQRGRAAAGPGGARRAHPGRGAPGDRRRRHGHADPGARASARRAPSGWCWSCATGSARCRSAPTALAGGARRRPGRTRSARRWSGSAGRPARPTRRWPRWRSRLDGEPAPPVPVLLKQAIRLLGRTR